MFVLEHLNATICINVYAYCTCVHTCSSSMHIIIMPTCVY